MKVYIVEDSTLFRDRLAALLADLGVTVVGHAAGAGEAIAGITAAWPDLVLLDLQLAEGSGLDVLRAVKPLPGIRVAIVTGYPEPPYRKACLEAGADFFFDKATAFDELVTLFSALRAGERFS